MKKEEFDILKTTRREDVLSTLKRIGEPLLTETGHGFEIFGAMPIRQAAEASTLIFSDKWQQKPAIGLISVVLAANRAYNKVVEPNLKRIEQNYPELKSFNDLSILIKSKSPEEFYDIWGHKDEKKYKTLKSLLAEIEKLKQVFKTAKNDFDLMNQWGAPENIDLLNYRQDPIGSLNNIGLATFQHLRMVFGVDTVKPDQRVKEVLEYEFGFTGLTDIKAVKAVGQIAAIASLKVITIDQILVKYGSSYYNQETSKPTLKQIALNLKSYGVDNEIISKATLLSLKQVERL